MPKEHVVQINHTAAERALYLGQAHEAPDYNGHSLRGALKEKPRTKKGPNKGPKPRNAGVEL